MFSNAELNVRAAREISFVLIVLPSWNKVFIIIIIIINVEPIARYSKCVLFWMQSWMLNSQLDIQDVCFRMQS